MITKLELTNFKCFNHHIIELSNLTLLAGSNASGKSSMIQALLLYLYTNGTQSEKIIASDALFIEIGSPRDLLSNNPLGDINEIKMNVEYDEKLEQYVKFQILPSSFTLDVIEKSMSCTSIYFQYLNAERIGPRITNEVMGDYNQVAVHGNNAAYQMELADLNKKNIHKLLKNGDSLSHKFSYYVEMWLSAIIGSMTVDVRVDYNKAITETRFKNKIAGENVIPTMTGFGITYVFPIVVAALLCTTEKNSLFIIENPEAHLHPYAQSNLGKFLALISLAGVQVIVETHSEHIIDGARLQLAKMQNTEHMMIHFFDHPNEYIDIQTLSLNKYGEVDHWPKGFFDQKQQDLRELMRCRKK